MHTEHIIAKYNSNNASISTIISFYKEIKLHFLCSFYAPSFPELPYMSLVLAPLFPEWIFELRIFHVSEHARWCAACADWSSQNSSCTSFLIIPYLILKEHQNYVPICYVKIISSKIISQYTDDNSHALEHGVMLASAMFYSIGVITSIMAYFFGWNYFFIPY